LANLFAISVGTISEAGRASAMLVSSLGKFLSAHRRFKMDLTAYQDIIAVDCHCAGLEAFHGAVPRRQVDAA
jgi:hypothetical protein